ncbi:MAG: rhomboid family intramembrane serine protease [Actinomycetota bacterium]|nr:rhomboid family intramembrane serine protease [Actinomycetota bacterium]
MFPLKDDIPTRRFPILTVALIVANVVMFFAFQGAFFDDAEFDSKVVEYGAIPYEITHPGKECGVVPGSERVACEGQPGVGDAPDQAPTWLTILTSMFMHGGLLHLGGNMLFLWIFGNNIEDSMGRPRFIAFYLLGGLAALLAQTIIEPNAAVPTIGASGAVAAVLGGYALLYPRARVVTVIFIIIFFTIVTLPALLVLGAWFLLQLLNGAGSLAQPVGEGGGVAYFAHIGGFLFGLLMIRLFADRVHEDYERAHRTPVY